MSLRPSADRAIARIVRQRDPELLDVYARVRMAQFAGDFATDFDYLDGLVRKERIAASCFS